jgi:hypothetical protein
LSPLPSPELDSMSLLQNDIRSHGAPRTMRPCRRSSSASATSASPSPSCVSSNHTGVIPISLLELRTALRPDELRVENPVPAIAILLGGHAGALVRRIGRIIFHPAAPHRPMHAQVARGLCHCYPAVRDQLDRFQFELPREFPSLQPL